MYTKVKFTGTRSRRMRVHVMVDGYQYRSIGYPAASGDIVTLTEVEADILTGKTKPVIDDSGKIITGYYVDGYLGEAGLTGEGWERVDPVVDETPKKTVSKPVVKAEPEAPAPAETSG